MIINAQVSLDQPPNPVMPSCSTPVPNALTGQWPTISFCAAQAAAAQVSKPKVMGLGDSSSDYTSYNDPLIPDYTNSSSPPVSTNYSDGFSLTSIFPSSNSSVTVAPDIADVPVGGGYNLSQFGTSNGGLNSNVISNIASSLTATASSILKAQFGTPQLNPGQYIQTLPNGSTVMYQQPAGVAVNASNPLSSFNFGSLLIPAIAIVAIIVVTNKK